MPQAENKVQLKAYAKVDAISSSTKRHSGLPVLLRVVMPPVMSERAPIDLVVVLDISCGAGLPLAYRMALLQRAMELVIEKLSSQDRLAIVQTPKVHEKDDLVAMTREGREQAITMLQSLAVSGNKKLSTALEKAQAILEGRNDEGKKKAGFIFLISDGEDSSILRETMGLKHPVHAFGFRGAHNARAMHYIANSSTGTYGILNDEHDRITEEFIASMNNIISIVAVQMEINIVCSGPSTAMLSAIESGRFKKDIEGDRKSGFIKVGPIHAGTVRNFIVYVDNVGEHMHHELPKMLTVHVKYMSQSSTEESSESQVVIVKKGMDGSSEVAAEMVRLEAVRIISDIIDKYNTNNRKGLVDELRQHWLSLKDSEYGREADKACLISGLAMEMQEMETHMGLSSGLSYMLSWQSCHTLQHQTRTRAVISSSAAIPKGRPAVDTLTAVGESYQIAAIAGADFGGGSLKRKYQQYTELDMIEQRLAYWSKVKGGLPLIHYGDRPDPMSTIFWEASRESIDRAMYHDVFLAAAYSTGRRSGSKLAECSCGSGTKNQCHLDSCP